MGGIGSWFSNKRGTTGRWVENDLRDRKTFSNVISIRFSWPSYLMIIVYHIINFVKVLFYFYFRIFCVAFLETHLKDSNEVFWPLISDQVNQSNAVWRENLFCLLVSESSVIS